MIQRIRGVAALALALALVAAPTAGCDSAPAEGDSCELEPSLSALQSGYFAAGCTFSGCHDARTAKGGLDLASPGLHARLVDIAVQDDNAAARGKRLVVAGDPDASFIVQKVEGAQESDEGSLMPEGADEPISPECRIATLREWIANGANDD
ncbi:MAG: hypothetical protein EP329_22870 [Deltaproteobacteria bacterium]|nr:MAG: hypothetical protein EP329_22870 [Deltaproteobacteria bacterium]